MKEPRLTKLVTQSSSGPALLGIIEPRWLEAAFKEFQAGKPEIYFGSSSSGLGAAARVPIRRVYFKVKGQANAIAIASFVGITDKNIPSKRLAGLEQDNNWKWYYGFTGLASLSTPVPLSELAYYSTGKRLRNDVPGSCLIQDPFE